MSGLALPANPRRPSKETNAPAVDNNQEASMTMDEMDTFFQSDEFRNMVGEDAFANQTTSLADITFDDLFPPIPASANSDQFPQIGNMPTMGPPTQMPTPPVMEANHMAGPRYHPEVGWYFPAQPASGFSTPMPPLPLISDGYTPASSIPSSLMPSALPSGATTPFIQPPKPKNSKRKYGPAAFLEEQAKKRVAAQQAATPLPPPSFDFSANKKEVPHPLRNRKEPPVVQTCVCTDKEALKIKRPKNAFIIYRSTVSKQIIKSLGRNDNQSVSKIAGQWWRQIKDTEEGKKYFRLAEEEAARHQLLYPDYKYKPGQSARNKFGSSHCTCGAYEANLKALQESEGGLGDYDFGHSYEANDDVGDDGLFIPPVSSRAAVREAHDRMARAAPIPDLASLGLPASQLAGAQAHIDALKRKRDQAEARDVDADEPLAKRRSPLNSTKDIDYSIPSEEDIFRPLTPEGRKGRPSQAGFLNSSPTMSHAGIRADSPARNTRSASLSRARSESPSQIIPPTNYSFDFGDEPLDFSADSDWEKLFADTGLTDYVQDNEVDADADPQVEVDGDAEADAQAEAEDEDGDNITVAQPLRRSSRGKSVDSQAGPPSTTMTTRSKKNSTSEEVSNSQPSVWPRRSKRNIPHASIASKTRLAGK